MFMEMAHVKPLVKAYFEAVYNHLVAVSSFVHLIVNVSDSFIERHPFILPHIRSTGDQRSLTLNIAPSACDQLVHTEHGVRCHLSFAGLRQVVDISFGEALGLTTPNLDYLISFNSVAVHIPFQGMMILGVSVQGVENNATPVETSVSPPKKPHLCIVK